MSTTDLDKPRCHCAVFGVFGNPHAAQLTYYGLLATATSGTGRVGHRHGAIRSCRSEAAVSCPQRFRACQRRLSGRQDLSETLVGSMAIGHNRYSTAGSANNKTNIQPFYGIVQGWEHWDRPQRQPDEFQEDQAGAAGRRDHLPDDLRHGDRPSPDRASRKTNQMSKSAKPSPGFRGHFPSSSSRTQPSSRARSPRLPPFGDRQERECVRRCIRDGGV